MMTTRSLTGKSSRDQASLARRLDSEVQEGKPSLSPVKRNFDLQLRFVVADNNRHYTRVWPRTDPHPGFVDLVVSVQPYASCR
jgi:hypothetical protein